MGLLSSARPFSASGFHKVYVVLDGELVVTTETSECTLGPLDSVYLAPGEARAVRNDSKRPATMLVVMPYEETPR